MWITTLLQATLWNQFAIGLKSVQVHVQSPIFNEE